MNVAPNNRIGVGLRPTHYPYLESEPPLQIGWFEAISENYMDSQGRPLSMLLRQRQRVPVALHGVSLSIASPAGADDLYLTRLKKLVERVEPFLVSDHLCWTRKSAHSLHDLFPFPLDDHSLALVAANVERVQHALGRTICLENISAYLNFDANPFAEAEFLAALSAKTGCGILFDINNLYVNSQNYGFDALAWVNKLPLGRVGQVHLAGHTDMGDFLFDTHARPVADAVWRLAAEILPRLPGVPVLLEWDEDIPPFQDVEREALKAAQFFGEKLVHANTA